MSRVSQTVIARLTPTITAGAYADGDVVGGLLTFDLATTRYSFDGQGGKVCQVVLYEDGSTNSAIFELVFFDTEPTTIADNAAFALSAVDAGYVLGSVPIVAADYLTVGADQHASKGEFTIPVTGLSDSNLYAYLVLNGSTPTYAATSGLQIAVSVCPDA